jgi:hypothetical protein
MGDHPWWEIKLAIQAADGKDEVSFNRIVSPPGVSN